MGVIEGPWDWADGSVLACRVCVFLVILGLWNGGGATMEARQCTGLSQTQRHVWPSREDQYLD